MKYSSLQRYVTSLASVSESPHFNYGSFRVGGRIFMTVPPEQSHVHVFVPDDARDPALVAYPGFVEKLHWGAKVVGLRIALDKADAKVVKALVEMAWHSKSQMKPVKQTTMPRTTPAAKLGK